MANKKLPYGVYTIRVDVAPDDVTHQAAKDQLATELDEAVADGLQINGIREPVYGLNEKGEKVVVAYEALAWKYRDSGQTRPQPGRRDGRSMLITGNGEPVFAVNV